MATKLQSAGRVVVGTDGSERANRAVEWAADRALARGLPLLVLYVAPNRGALGIDAIGADAFDDPRGHKRVQAALGHVEELVGSLRASYPGIDVSSAVVEGNPAQVLAEATKNAAMVVVGARGASAPRSVKMLGGVSDAVTAHARGPIAIVTDEAHDNPHGPVVVGVDDSEPSMLAVATAFDAARVRGVPLVAVHAFVQRPPNEAVWDEGEWTATMKETSWEQADKELGEKVRGWLAGAIAENPDVPLEVRIVRASPHDALVVASMDAGLLVVGSRGRGGFRGLLLGSTSKHVIREAHCPVVVTRGPTWDADLL